MKQNKKSIEANLRNKMAAQYKAKTEELENEIKRLRESNRQFMNRYYESERERLEMKDKLQQLEDWNQRLQEYMDMNEEDRKSYVETLRAETELNNAIGNLKSVKYIQHLMGLLL